MASIWPRTSYHTFVVYWRIIIFVIITLVCFRLIPVLFDLVIHLREVFSSVFFCFTIWFYMYDYVCMYIYNIVNTSLSLSCNFSGINNKLIMPCSGLRCNKILPILLGIMELNRRISHIEVPFFLVSSYYLFHFCYSFARVIKTLFNLVILI